MLAYLVGCSQLHSLGEIEISDNNGRNNSGSQKHRRFQNRALAFRAFWLDTVKSTAVVAKLTLLRHQLHSWSVDPPGLGAR